MKKFSNLSIFFCLLIVIVFPNCNSTDKKSTEDTKAKTVVNTLVPDLKAKADPEKVKAFEEVIKTKNDALSIQYLGHYAYLNRHLELAAWLYAEAAEKKPDDYANLSNLGLTLHELSVMKNEPALLQQAVDILQKAVDGAPDKAATQNNLGYALLRQYKSNNDASLLKKAETHFLKAIELDPKTAVYHSHLADVYAAMKKTPEAVRHLNHAYQLDPLNGVLISSSSAVPEFAAEKETRSYCDTINFNCDKNCPHSIIGRIQLISCEIAQQDARMACAAGKPYATSYNCDEQMPSTGFLIPGLNSGFGIITPWGKLVVMVQGGGNVDVKVEVNTPVPGVRFTAAGRYNPSSGMTTTQFGPSVSVNLYNQGTVAPVLNQFNMGPASVKINMVSGSNERGLQLESYDTPVYIVH